MAINNEVSAARTASRSLLRKLKSQTMKSYIKAADEVAKEIRLLEIKQTLAPDGSYELTLKSRRNLERALRREADVLKESINNVAKGGTAKGVGLNVVIFAIR